MVAVSFSYLPIKHPYDICATPYVPNTLPCKAVDQNKIANSIHLAL
jgi:hypothetical protein